MLGKKNTSSMTVIDAQHPKHVADRVTDVTPTELFSQYETVIAEVLATTEQPFNTAEKHVRELSKHCNALPRVTDHRSQISDTPDSHGQHATNLSVAVCISRELPGLVSSLESEVDRLREEIRHTTEINVRAAANLKKESESLLSAAQQQYTEAVGTFLAIAREDVVKIKDRALALYRHLAERSVDEISTEEATHVMEQIDLLSGQLSTIQEQLANLSLDFVAGTNGAEIVDHLPTILEQLEHMCISIEQDGAPYQEQLQCIHIPDTWKAQAHIPKQPAGIGQRSLTPISFSLDDLGITPGAYRFPSGKRAQLDNKVSTLAKEHCTGIRDHLLALCNTLLTESFDPESVLDILDTLSTIPNQLTFVRTKLEERRLTMHHSGLLEEIMTLLPVAVSQISTALEEFTDLEDRSILSKKLFACLATLPPSWSSEAGLPKEEHYTPPASAVVGIEPVPDVTEDMDINVSHYSSLTSAVSSAQSLVLSYRTGFTEPERIEPRDTVVHAITEHAQQALRAYAEISLDVTTEIDLGEAVRKLALEKKKRTAEEDAVAKLLDAIDHEMMEDVVGQKSELMDEEFRGDARQITKDSMSNLGALARMLDPDDDSKSDPITMQLKDALFGKTHVSKAATSKSNKAFKAYLKQLREDQDINGYNIVDRRIRAKLDMLEKLPPAGIEGFRKVLISTMLQSILDRVELRVKEIRTGEKSKRPTISGLEFMTGSFVGVLKSVESSMDRSEKRNAKQNDKLGRPPSVQHRSRNIGKVG